VGRVEGALVTRRPLREADWQEQVTDLARLHGWLYVHHRPARTEKGWRTPVQGPLGKGWPDLVLVRERVLFVELKRDGGGLRPEQVLVIDALRAAGADVRVWRPRDWDEVVETLGATRAAAA